MTCLLAVTTDLPAASAARIHPAGGSTPPTAATSRSRGCRGVAGPVPQPLLIKKRVFSCRGDYTKGIASMQINACGCDDLIMARQEGLAFLPCHITPSTLPP